uniref:DUF223 domain-containing protein n=1 Tax=Setaria viridis TaxID=4556 RepID=A0A4U6UKU9_SETVI|nr:hypothetical protein SEVIR_5G173500v2 [Setaria viridis]
MGSSYMSLSRKRVTLPAPLISLPALTTNSAMVFWKGNIREYGGHEYLRVILVDEQGTKMEAVACGDHHMMFNSVLIEGETYDFLGVYFTPTYVDLIPNMYRLCEYYAVISECPRAFRKFEDVYRQPVDTFVDVIGVVVYASEIQDRGDFRRRPNRHVVIMNQRYVYLCTYEIICHAMGRSELMLLLVGKTSS